MKLIIKTLPFAVVVILVSAFTLTQGDRNTAFAEKAGETRVFLLNEPTSEYTVEFEVEYTPTELPSSIRHIASNMASKAKSKGAFDAIMYDGADSNKGKAIKFKEEEKEFLARVQEIEGVPVYMMCEPNTPYDIAFEVGFIPPPEDNIKGIATHLVKLALQRTQTSNIPFDAVVYHGHGVLEQRADAIKYR